jgi:chloride channel protein, CIC family
MESLRVDDLVRRATARLGAMRLYDGTMLALGAATGLVTGLLAALLITLVRVVQGIAFGRDVGTLELLLVPAVGGLLVGLLVTYWAPESSGSGVVRVMEMLALRGGRARKRIPSASLSATSLALGTGASGGRETPIVLIGGSVGSLLGQAFHMDEERLRSLVAAGAAAGIGASFNAPIGGMLFAIELIVGGLRARSLQVIVVSSVVGSVTARQLIGEDLIYRPSVAVAGIEGYVLSHPMQLIAYALLGVAAAGVGVGFMRTEAHAERWFEWLRDRMWRPLTLALAGLGVGAIALLVPEVLGSGEDLPPIHGLADPIQQMIDGNLSRDWQTVAFLALLLVAKMVATAITIGSGSAVGSFAPSMFMGAALGAAIGIGGDLVFPGLELQPGAIALVGMAAVFSAAARAPLTAILIVFELTGDYGLVLPLMLAAGLAVYAAERLTPDSIYTRPLRKRGIVYQQPEDIDIMQTVEVREVMTTDHPTVPPDLPVHELRDKFTETRSHGFVVVDDDGRLRGVVALSDLARADSHPSVRSGERLPDELTVRDICTERVLTVAPEDPVFRALHRMAAIDVGRIPVVSDEDRRFRGVVRRGDVVHAYQRAITRSLSEQQQRESRRLRDLAGVRFIEYIVDTESDAAGQAVRDIPWPKRTVLTSIRRRGEVVMPTGDTVLEPGDEVVVLTALETAPEVRRLIGRRASAPSTQEPDELG